MNISGLPSTDEGRPLWNALECAWSQQGWLAIRQSESSATSDFNSVVLLDAEFRVIARPEAVQERFNLAGWLPDGSGVLLNRRGPQIEPLGPVIFEPGGGMFELPFEVDFAVGVIP